MLLALILSLEPIFAPYGWSWDDEKDVDSDPWTPCEKKHGPEVIRGFCRLSCTAKWSYAPERMDCPMLDNDALLSRAHSRGLEVSAKSRNHAGSNLPHTFYSLDPLSHLRSAFNKCRKTASARSIRA